MDFIEIDQIMSAKHLADNPAFDNLHILIESIPCTDTCPLGLYYPDTATVILPPDASEAALLHELGHRYGHYYYNDLSEKYAESFRARYQPKGRALLYVGNDFGNLPRFGSLFEEGERGAVEIALLQPLTADELHLIKSQFHSYGEPAPRVHYGNSEIPFVRVEFTKGVDWVVIIGGAMAATIVATVGAMGYAIYKVSKELPWIIPLSIAGTGALFLLRAMTREAAKRGLA